VDVRLLRIRGCVNAEVTTNSIIITSAAFNSSAQWGKTWPDVETADYQNGERVNKGRGEDAKAITDGA
jgi:hypothetical protein